MSVTIAPNASVAAATCAMLIKDELREYLERAEYVKQAGLNFYINTTNCILPNTVSYSTHIVKSGNALTNLLKEILPEVLAFKFGETWADLLQDEKLQEAVQMLTLDDDVVDSSVEDMRLAVVEHLKATIGYHDQHPDRRLRAVVVKTRMGTISFELKGELSPYNPSGEILLVLELDKHTDL